MLHHVGVFEHTIQVGMEAKTKKMGSTYSLYKSYTKIAHASEQSLSTLRLIGTL